MGWLRVDDEFPEHPKFDAAIDAGGAEAIVLWLRAGCLSRKFKTNGFVSNSTLKRLAPGRAGRTRINALVQAGLWLPVEGGIKVHDFEEYNPPDEPTAPRPTESAEEKKRRDARDRASAYRARLQQKKRDIVSRDGVTQNVTDPRDESRDAVTEKRDEQRDAVTSPPLASPPLNSPSPSQITRDARDESRDAVTEARDANRVTVSHDVTAQHTTRAPTRLQSMLATSYAEGIREASGQPFAEPIAPHELKQLEVMCRSYKRGADPIEWQVWLKSSATEYRTAKADAAEYQSGFSPIAWAKWVQGGKPRAGVKPSQQQQQPEPSNPSSALPYFPGVALPPALGGGVSPRSVPQQSTPREVKP